MRFQTSIAMVKRLAVRSLFLLGLTIAGFYAIETLVALGRDRVSTINTDYPELIMILRGVATFTWLEMSILWIRMAVSPHTDVQKSTTEAQNNPISSAIVSVSHDFVWVARILILMKLCGMLQ